MPPPDFKDDRLLSRLSPAYRSLLGHALGRSIKEHSESGNKKNNTLNFKDIWENKVLSDNALITGEDETLELRPLSNGQPKEGKVEESDNDINTIISDTSSLTADNSGHDSHNITSDALKIPKKKSVKLIDLDTNSDVFSTTSSSFHLKTTKEQKLKKIKGRRNVPVETELIAFDKFNICTAVTFAPSTNLSDFPVSNKTETEHNKILDSLLDDEGIQVRGCIIINIYIYFLS